MPRHVNQFYGQNAIEGIPGESNNNVNEFTLSTVCAHSVPEG